MSFSLVERQCSKSDRLWFNFVFIMNMTTCCSYILTWMAWAQYGDILLGFRLFLAWVTKLKDLNCM